MEDITVSMSEFARIVKVDQSAITHALKTGHRLVNSIVQVEGKVRIKVFEGCLEWWSNKDHRKDRKDPSTASAANLDPLSMDPAQSTRVIRHYEALQAKMDFEKKAGSLLSIDKFKTEAFTVARGVRDSLLYLPNEAEREFKRMLTEFIRRHLGEERIAEFTPDLNEFGLAFRVYQKASITKALRDLLNERFGSESLRFDSRTTV